MPGDRDGLRERLRVDDVIDRTEELRHRAPIETLGDGLDPGALRERIDAFYAWAFLPPSHTDDGFDDRAAVATPPSPATTRDDQGGFDLAAWLDLDQPVRASASETPAVSGTAPNDGDTYEGFAFAAWLADGDTGPWPSAVTEVDGLPAGPVDDASRGLYGVPPDRSPDVHPMRLATASLFVTAATLTVLTVGGVLPPLGPTAGMPV